MLPATETAYILFLGLQYLAGLLANVFIMAVNVADWVQGRSLNSCDHILVALGFSNILFLCTNVVDNGVYYQWSCVYYSSDLFRVFIFLLCLLVTTSSWLTAGLCGFYCVKIVHFSHHILYWLKQRISRVVSWMLFASVGSSLVLNLPGYWDIAVVSDANTTCSGTDGLGLREVWSLPYTVAQVTLGFALPLLLAVLAISLILASLCRHARQMRQSVDSVSRPQLEALSGAARTVSCLLLMYICFHLANPSIMLNMLPTGSDRTTLSNIVLVTYPTAQSTVLIQGNSKLKRACRRILRCAHRD